MTVRAIETEYRGTLYRSRLEARWAATFDLLGIPYCYEPFDFAGYVPDFMLTGQHPALVEVRPVCTKDEFEQVAESIEQRLGVRGWDEDLLILGALVVPIYGERDLG
jgi:hypothetical protein